jgi:hypothetical protein
MYPELSPCFLWLACLSKKRKELNCYTVIPFLWDKEIVKGHEFKVTKVVAIINGDMRTTNMKV